MNIEQIKSLSHAQPFKPFEVYMADGRSVRVKHPDFLAFGGRSITVYDDLEVAETIDVRLITSVKPAKVYGSKRNGH